MRNPSTLSILLLGYNGVNNIGSEARLLATINDLRATLGDRLGRISVMSMNEENQRRFIKDPDVDILHIGPRSLLDPAVIGVNTDVLMLIDGSAWMDRFSSIFLNIYAASAWVARLKGQRIVSYGTDCIIDKASNRRRAARTLNHAVDLITVRSSESQERMELYGVDRTIHAVADCSYLYPAPSQEDTDALLGRLGLTDHKEPIIGIIPKELFRWPVNFRPLGRRKDRFLYPFHLSWSRRHREYSRHYVQQMARYADYLALHHKAKVVILAMESMDTPVAQAMYNRMLQRDSALLLPSDAYDVDDITALLSVMDFQVTSRYHSTVLGSAFGLPMIGISADDRMESVFCETGMHNYYLQYLNPATEEPAIPRLYDVLVDKTEDLLANKKSIRRSITKSHQRYVTRALHGRNVLQRWFQAAFPSLGTLVPRGKNS